MTDATTGEAWIDDLLRPERLQRYLRQALGRDDDLVIEGRALSGSSNVTAFVRFGDERLVVRRPPAGDLLPTAHDMLREVSFLRAFAGSEVPVARVLASCEDADVIGAPFYAMDRVDGIVLQQEEADYLRDPEAMSRLSAALVDVLINIHALPWQGLNLPGRPTGYLQRQVERWTKQLALTPSATRLVGLDEVTSWVQANVPSQGETTVVHGDYGLHNLILDPRAPRIAAVLDWEMATLGDPLADVVWFLQDWGRVRKSGGVGNPANYVTHWPGAWTREQMLQRYADGTGRSLSDEHFYRVFSTWKGIIVTEGLYSAYLEGNAANPTVVRFETEVPSQVEHARSLVHPDWKEET
jgi:aminoglycoside phosphotransferase (APT) family kinase protein